MTEHEQELIKTLNKNLDMKNKIELKKMQNEELYRNDIKFAEEAYLREIARFFEHGTILIIFLDVLAVLAIMFFIILIYKNVQM